MNNRTANIVAGALGGFGWFSGAGAFIFYFLWRPSAPRLPDPTRGLTMAMNDHGAVFYFNGMQWVVFHGLLIGGLGLFFLAIGLAPKKNVRRHRTPFSIGFRADPDDPSKVRNWAMAAGALLSMLLCAGLFALVRASGS